MAVATVSQKTAKELLGAIGAYIQACEEKVYYDQHPEKGATNTSEQMEYSYRQFQNKFYSVLGWWPEFKPSVPKSQQLFIPHAKGEGPVDAWTEPEWKAWLDIPPGINS